MFKNLTYKQKNKYLLIGFAVFVLLSYMLAIKDTVSAVFEYRELKQKEARLGQAPQEMRSLQVKIKGLNYLIDNKEQAHEGVHASLLNAITAYCDENGILLREYPGSRENIQNDLVVETNIFEVQGPFAKLLNLVYLLEQKHRIGKVASVKFQSKKDAQTRENILTVTVYIQNVKKHDHEDHKDA